MMKFALAALLSAAVVLPAMAQSKPPGDTSKRAINNQTAVACNLCFTCGGDWTVFSGAWNVVNAANNVQERGSSCSGASALRVDTRPFLCCR